MKAKLVLSTCVCLSFFAAANDEDLKKEILIKASHSSSNLKAKVLDYRENVLITQGSMRISASLASVKSDLVSDDKTYLLSGTPVTFQQLMNSGAKVNAEAGQITYEPSLNKITVRYGAKITLDNSTFTGDSIIYDLKSEQVNATGNPVIFSRKLSDGTPIAIEAKQIKLDSLKRIVTVDGNAIVRQEGTEARGSRIVYKIDSEQLDMESVKNETVTTIIQPKSKN